MSFQVFYYSYANIFQICDTNLANLTQRLKWMKKIECRAGNKTIFITKGFSMKLGKPLSVNR